MKRSRLIMIVPGDTSRVPRSLELKNNTNRAGFSGHSTDHIRQILLNLRKRYERGTTKYARNGAFASLMPYVRARYEPATGLYWKHGDLTMESLLLMQPLSSRHVGTRSISLKPGAGVTSRLYVTPYFVDGRRTGKDAESQGARQRDVRTGGLHTNLGRSWSSCSVSETCA